jgi:predicted amidophosphoribosyltransferase
MTLDLMTETPRRCVCCELDLGPEARMGICGDCVHNVRGMHLWCSLHRRRVLKVPELR